MEYLKTVLNYVIIQNSLSIRFVKNESKNRKIYGNTLNAQSKINLKIYYACIAFFGIYSYIRGVNLKE